MSSYSYIEVFDEETSLGEAPINAGSTEHDRVFFVNKILEAKKERSWTGYILGTVVGNERVPRVGVSKEVSEHMIECEKAGVSPDFKKYPIINYKQTI